MRPFTPAIFSPSALELFLVAICFLPVSFSVSTAQADSDRGVWRQAAPAPTKRTEVSAAAVHGKIYVVGGFEEPGLSNVMNMSITPVVQEYDPATDKWTDKAPMPAGLHHVGIGAVDGKLYVIGGYKQSGLSVWQPVATVYAYDPAADSWTERTPMPTARGALAVAVHEGKLYAIGGYDRTVNSAAVEVYDPAHDSWTSRAMLPTARDHLAASAAGGKIYAVGGRIKGDYRKNLSVTEVYDPGRDHWTRGAELPTARSGITAAETGGRIYVFGGEGGDGTFRENEAYNPSQDTWQTMAAMPGGRHGLGSAVVDGRIYVIDGGPVPGGSFSNANEVFSPPRSGGGH
ncbi:hypothetical protein W02_36170 [Nitrospira sp. KM1]|nr:hypothetical protein W02_36170 [Nitrospira sp. KM1]